MVTCSNIKNKTKTGYLAGFCFICVNGHFFIRPGLLMATLTVEPASNKTIVRAGRLIGFPVFGWMIVRAFCFLVLNTPKRRSSTVSPFVRPDTISLRQVWRIAVAWRTARPCFLMSAFMMSAFFMVISELRSISGSASKGPRFPWRSAFQAGGKGTEDRMLSR